MTTIDGFKRMLMGDYLGSRTYFGSCCGCSRQFMSTHEVVYVPTDETRTARGYRHGPACEHCARKSPPTKPDRLPCQVYARYPHVVCSLGTRGCVGYHGR